MFTIKNKFYASRFAPLKLYATEIDDVIMCFDEGLIRNVRSLLDGDKD